MWIGENWQKEQRKKWTMQSYRIKGEGLFYCPQRDLLHCLPRLLAIATLKAAEAYPDRRKEIFSWVHQLRVLLNDSKDSCLDLDVIMEDLSYLMADSPAKLVIPVFNMVILAKFCLGVRETGYSEEIKPEHMDSIMDYLTAKPYLPKSLKKKLDKVMRDKVPTMEVVDAIPKYERVYRSEEKSATAPGGDLYEEILVKSIVEHACALGAPIEEIRNRIFDNAEAHKKVEDRPKEKKGWFKRIFK